MSLDKLIERNKNKLNKLIEDNADYKIILKQSKLLDKYIVEKMRHESICLKF